MSIFDDAMVVGFFLFFYWNARVKEGDGVN